MEEILHQVRGGMAGVDESGKAQLIERLIDDHEQQILKLIYFYVNDWSSAQDICQEVFIKAYNALDDFNQESTYKTWIYRIAINKCKDYKKSAYFRKNTIVDRFHRLLNKEEAGSPEDELLRSEHNDTVAQHIFSLPIKYREAIILYYYEDLSTDEIGELLKVNPSTVRTRLNRGREKLKEKMGGRLSHE
jgi:RNA polymerase sigma-70 factor, ECF subfamily